ncbi:MAG TPA: hypothetical protein VFJ95_11010 [Gammaproteobacteria bacterium]|nr:hypothetical protein [Gammaproteobacteria bacterium]
MHTLEQAPLIRRLIAANKAIGDYESAWEIEQDLLTLAERYPNDLRTARILSDSAASRMDLLQRYDAGAAAPEIVLGCYYAPVVPYDQRQPTNCLAGSRSLVRKRLLRESQVLYSTAINIVLQNEGYASEDLPPLLWNLVRNSYRYEVRGHAARGRAHYTGELGRRSLIYLRAYQAANSEPWLARIETLVAIADWDLVHAAAGKEIDQALDEYRQAYALLKEHQVPQEAIDRIFSPELPIVLPAFQPNPLDAMETPRSAGHIEVGFEVTREGRSKRVRVLDATENSLRTDERRLTQAIAGRIFRPRVKDGVFPDSVPVVVRYYYEEDQPWFAAVGAEDIGP